MRKKVVLYGDPRAAYSAKIKELLEAQDVVLDVRDLSTQPLSYHEIARLLRHLELKHFVTPDFDWNSVKHDDQGRPDREEIFRMMAADNALLRWPLLESGRLLTVGDDLRRLRRMLLIRDDEKVSNLRADNAA